MSVTYNINDIPLGTCCRCKKKQSAPGADGYWICGMTEKWACYDCKYGKNGPEIPSRAFAKYRSYSSDISRNIRAMARIFCNQQ